MSRDRSKQAINLWFRSVALGGRKSCPTCAKKTVSGFMIHGYYQNGKWRTCNPVCEHCWREYLREVFQLLEPNSRPYVFTYKYSGPSWMPEAGTPVEPFVLRCAMPFAIFCDWCLDRGIGPPASVARFDNWRRHGNETWTPYQKTLLDEVITR